MKRLILRLPSPPVVAPITSNDVATSAENIDNTTTLPCSELATVPELSSLATGVTPDASAQETEAGVVISQSSSATMTETANASRATQPRPQRVRRRRSYLSDDEGAGGGVFVQPRVVHAGDAHEAAASDSASSSSQSTRRHAAASDNDNASDSGDSFLAEQRTLLYAIPILSSATSSGLPQKRAKRRALLEAGGARSAIAGSNALLSGAELRASLPYVLSEGARIACKCCMRERDAALRGAEKRILATFDDVYDASVPTCDADAAMVRASNADVASALTPEALALARIMLVVHGGCRLVASAGDEAAARAARKLAIYLATAVLQRKATVSVLREPENDDIPTAGAVYVLVCREWELSQAPRTALPTLSAAMDTFAAACERGEWLQRRVPCVKDVAPMTRPAYEVRSKNSRTAIDCAAIVTAVEPLHTDSASQVGIDDAACALASRDGHVALSVGETENAVIGASGGTATGTTMDASTRAAEDTTREAYSVPMMHSRRVGRTKQATPACDIVAPVSTVRCAASIAQRRIGISTRAQTLPSISDPDSFKPRSLPLIFIDVATLVPIGVPLAAPLAFTPNADDEGAVVTCLAAAQDTESTAHAPVATQRPRRAAVARRSLHGGRIFSDDDALMHLIRIGYHAPVFIEDQPGRGRVVKAAGQLPRGAFVVEYGGQLIDGAEANRRHLIYGRRSYDPSLPEGSATESAVGCYMFFFSDRSIKHCIDATAERPEYGFGRLISHSRKHPNCKPRRVVVDGVPHIVLVTLRDVGYAEELTYDYGERDPKVVQAFEWLK